ncbi:hypothetical protein NA57DRAFT_81600 [Rhizodiscina lignyota]|uniref:Uncharacterized protein n=1 Tax=Rhizodiscina lignyota TaxID=1504668 RepID=A0A9P4M4X6_9PEZI|nr:hypothetical protein NA57DRAFT_81600 [Rhizodiscina lignyota]
MWRTAASTQTFLINGVEEPISTFPHDANVRCAHILNGSRGCQHGCYQTHEDMRGDMPLNWYCNNVYCSGHPSKYYVQCCGTTPWICAERAQSAIDLSGVADTLLPGCDGWGLEIICDGYADYLESADHIQEVAMGYATGEEEYVGDGAVVSDFQAAAQEVERFRANMPQWLKAMVPVQDRRRGIVPQELLGAGEAHQVGGQLNNVFGGNNDGHSFDGNELGLSTTEHMTRNQHIRGTRPSASNQNLGDPGIRVYGHGLAGDDPEVPEHEGEYGNDPDEDEEEDGEQDEEEEGDDQEGQSSGEDERQAIAESLKAAKAEKAAATRRQAELEAEEQQQLEEIQRVSREEAVRARREADMRDRMEEEAFMAEQIRMIEEQGRKEEAAFAKNRRKYGEIEAAKQQKLDDAQLLENLRRIELREKEEKEKRESEEMEMIRQTIKQSLKTTETPKQSGTNNAPKSKQRPRMNVEERRTSSGAHAVSASPAKPASRRAEDPRASVKPSAQPQPIKSRPTKNGALLKALKVHTTSASKPASNNPNSLRQPKTKASNTLTVSQTQTSIVTTTVMKSSDIASRTFGKAKKTTKDAATEQQRLGSATTPDPLLDGTREQAPQHPWREAEAKLGLLHNEHDSLPGYSEMAAPGMSIEADYE